MADTDASTGVIDPGIRGGRIVKNAEKIRDKLKASLKEAYENGWIVFDHAKPAERLEWFLEQTYPVDMSLLLNPDLSELRRTGQVGELEVEKDWRVFQEWQQQALMAEEQGMQVGPGPEQPPGLWPILLAPQTTVFSFELAQSDFIKLWHAQERKLDAQPEPEPVLQELYV